MISLILVVTSKVLAKCDIIIKPTFIWKEDEYGHQIISKNDIR